MDDSSTTHPATPTLSPAFLDAALVTLANLVAKVRSFYKVCNSTFPCKLDLTDISPYNQFFCASSIALLFVLYVFASVGRSHAPVMDVCECLAWRMANGVPVSFLHVFISWVARQVGGCMTQSSSRIDFAAIDSCLGTIRSM